MNIRYTYIVLGLIALFICATAWAQTTQTTFVQSSAGGAAQAGAFTLVFTVSQPSPVGQATAGQLTLSSGFIYTLDVASISVSTPAPPIEIGKPVPITWSVVGGTVANVKIEFSRDNGASFQTIVATTANDGTENITFRPPITSQARIRISDVLSGALPGTSGAFAITAQTFNIATKPDAQPGGSDQTAYRIISVPARLNASSNSTQAVLEDNLGPYDNTKWRFFDYNSGNFNEYPNTRAIEAGRGFFLIVKDAGIQINAGSAASTSTYVGDAVFFYDLASGWNLVGNPYHELSIPVSALSLANNETVSLITRTSAGWSTPVAALQPWEGYAIKVSSATTLTMRPSFSGAAAEPLAKTEESTLWAIRIKAQCQEARDENNLIGLAADAKTAWDSRDLYEPPAIGEFVTVDFPHDDWAERADRYTTDFRPEDSANDGQVWELAVRSNIPDRVNLAFEHFSEVPPEMQIYLIDDAAQIAQDVRANPRYSLLPIPAAKEKRLKLAVGPKKFVEKIVADLAPIPETFELSQNYPNPFNPETAIRFGLPQASRVTLKVFDLTGREVATLLANEEFPAGRYQRIWDGRDDQGRQVGSGVYFYRFTAGSFGRTMKLTLLR